MLLQHYHTLPVIQFFRILAREGAIFVKILNIFEFFASWWYEVAWFGQFVVLQINYDVIKLRKIPIMTSFWWRHQITSP